MQWEIVGIGLLALLVVVLVVLRALFLNRLRTAAAAKGNELGVSLEDRVKRGDLDKLAVALRFEDAAAATVATEAGLAQVKRAVSVHAGRWNLRVINPDDVVFELTTEAASQLRVVSSREALGIVQGGRDWIKVVKAVEEAAAAHGSPVVRERILLRRSAEAIAGDHVWTLSEPV